MQVGVNSRADTGLSVCVQHVMRNVKVTRVLHVCVAKLGEEIYVDNGSFRGALRSITHGIFLFCFQVAGRFPAKEHRETFHLFSERLPPATTALWRWMRAKMLPSPSKFHYTFNMRELSRVFQVSSCG